MTLGLQSRLGFCSGQVSVAMRVIVVRHGTSGFGFHLAKVCTSHEQTISKNGIFHHG